VVAPYLVGPAAALVQGEPNVSLTVADNRLSAGETTTLEVNAVNRGELQQGSEQGNAQAENRVTTARGLTIRPQSQGPITVRSGVIAVRSVSDGAAVPARFQVTVAEDAEPGTYTVPVQIEYRYTSQVSERGSHSHSEETVSETRNVRVVVDEEARFEVVGVEARSPGESGTFALDVENTGEATATDAVVTLSSLTGDMQFGAGSGGGQAAPQGQQGQGEQGAQQGQKGQGAQQAQRSGGSQQGASVFVDEWAPGEQRTLLFRGSVAADTPVTELPASLSVEYTDEDGVVFASESTIGITPESDQTFSFEPRNSSLRVGQEGTVRGTFVNEGPSDAENVVVTLEPPGRNVEVLQPEVAVGDLAAGESVDVAFDVEVSTAGRSGPRQFSLSTDYESAGGDERTADPIRFRQNVEPRRDVFSVEASNGGVTAGETGRLVLEVTNNEDETLTDVSAKLFTSQPLSAEDDEAYIAEIEPGETVTVPFRVSAGGGAMAKDYPVSLDFQYVDASGETRLTDTYRVPVTVEESGGRFFGLVGLAGVASLALLLPATRRFRHR
jgi:hypothetical protein